MSLTGFSISLVTVLVLTLISVAANRKLRDRERLPMQWSIGGKVNWTAPRRIALAFTPALAGIVLLAAALGYAREPDREVGVLTLMALCFAAAHLLHLWLIQRRTLG